MISFENVMTHFLYAENLAPALQWVLSVKSALSTAKQRNDKFGESPTWKINFDALADSRLLLCTKACFFPDRNDVTMPEWNSIALQ